MTKPVGVTRALRCALLGAASAAAIGAAGSAAARDVTDQMLLNAANDPANWIMAPRDYASTRYSTLTQVNAGNVLASPEPRFAGYRGCSADLGVS